MISRPAERLIRHPGPAGIAVNPATFGVGPPVARLLRFAWLPDVTVVSRLAPFAVGIELFIEHSVSGCGWFLRASFRFFGDHRGRCSRGRFLGGRRCRRRGFPVGDRFFARFESGLVLREALLLSFHALGSETILDLPLHLRFAFFFGLLFLAGNEKRQGSD
jgi:hypothetical protein